MQPHPPDPSSELEGERLFRQRILSPFLAGEEHRVRWF